jgi:hypothetical protein
LASRASISRDSLRPAQSSTQVSLRSVLDVMEAAFAHGRKYRHPGRTAPWANGHSRGPSPYQREWGIRDEPSYVVRRCARDRAAFCGSASRRLVRARERPPDRESPLRQRGTSARSWPPRRDAVGVEVRALREREDPVRRRRASDRDGARNAGGDGSLPRSRTSRSSAIVPFVCVPFGTATTSRATRARPRRSRSARCARSPRAERAHRRRPRGRAALPEQRLARRVRTSWCTAASTTAAGARRSRACARVGPC